MSTGENIKRIRNIRGMTQKELGIAIGIGEESASPRMAQYETGNRTPRESMLNKMAAVLEVDPRNISIPTGYREEDMIYRLLALEDYFPERSWREIPRPEMLQSTCIIKSSMTFCLLGE